MCSMRLEYAKSFTRVAVCYSSHSHIMTNLRLCNYPFYMYLVITGLLEEADGVAKGDLPSHFEKISAECRLLQKFVSDSTVFLTSYDLRNSQRVSIIISLYIHVHIPITTGMCNYGSEFSLTYLVIRLVLVILLPRLHRRSTPLDPTSGPHAHTSPPP